MRNYITNKILSFFLLVQILLINIVAWYPEWVEKYYSNGFYPFVSRFLRRVFGWIPLSIGDLLYALLFFICVRWIWLLIKTHFAPFREHIYTFLGFISVIFFVFNLFWGFNYYRIPLYERLQIASISYTPEQLINTTNKHIDRLNRLQLALVGNDSIPVKVNYKRRNIYKRAAKEYQHFYFDSLDFHFNGKSIKSSLISTPLSYMGFSGYLNPFTGESQVNKRIPKADFPVTTCHEMAHQLGYASEDEANYIAYLACRKNEDLYFQFSGELLAVRHLLFSVSQYDSDLYKNLLKKLNTGALKNLQITHDFWDSYKNPFEPYFKKFYDLFLKANKQDKGIQSYNAMVGYLINNPKD